MTTLTRNIINPALANGTLELLSEMGQWVLRVVRTRVERNHLAGLTEEQLHDIGVDRSEALAESRRSLTDLPQNRW